ncbi:hypothetical protein MIND_01274200 [Mycena indigotica]|uniref:Uncharacterized protein n=1 Tax=Mycena indigotica TaxID=2126181 RepID=A0A8H6VRF9_9AGAR|nr:uncharacterized protein MIND_01274200 [Mycena indigotica]KAF7291302.1 hypothetical protein MIND_01274200 [Mycena indigotica]
MKSKAGRRALDGEDGFAMIDTIRATHQSQLDIIDNLRAEVHILRGARDALHAELGEVRDALAEEVNAKLAHHHENTQLREALGTMRQMHHADLTAAQEQYEHALAAKEEEHRFALEWAEQQHSQEFAAADEDHEEALEAADQRYERERAAHEETIAELETLQEREDAVQQSEDDLEAVMGALKRSQESITQIRQKRRQTDGSGGGDQKRMKTEGA